MDEANSGLTAGARDKEPTRGARNTNVQETPAWPVGTGGRYPPEARLRKYATEMHDEEELMLLKGDVIYDGMACRTMNDVTADCQSAKYEEKNKREPDDSRTEQKYTSG